MSPDEKELLYKAGESLKAARMMLEGGFPGFAASRAYYTMFYVAQAFLEREEMAFSKHSAVISFFGKTFSGTGRVPSEFHRYLLEAQAARLDGDYTAPEKVSREQAALHIEHAQKFLDLGEKMLGPKDESKG
ncbi:MAG TPA: HEPN domain-containing protein [bacterium]|nr:HEPN domain-containing protein [bacterium]